MNCLPDWRGQLIEDPFGNYLLARREQLSGCSGICPGSDDPQMTAACHLLHGEIPVPGNCSASCL